MLTKTFASLACLTSPGKIKSPVVSLVNWLITASMRSIPQ